MAKGVANAFPDVQLHPTHLWENGPGQRLLTAHVVVNANANARDIIGLIEGLRKYLHAEWGIQHVTLEPEVEACENRKTFPV